MTILSGARLASPGVPRDDARVWRRRGVVPFLAACVGAASVVVLAPSIADAAQSASANCAHVPASKVSSIVGWRVTLGDALVEGATIGCLYERSAGNVTIEKETGMSASGIATRQKAEAGHKKLFYASQPKPLPKGTTISFSPLSALGPIAFYWTGMIDGSPWSGADAFKGTTGYFSEMPGTLQRSKLEQLERLAISA